MTELCNFKKAGNWLDVKTSARTTVGLEESNVEPDGKWKKNILLAEHSPIRKIRFSWKWADLPYFVSVHFVRHSIGILHYVKTSRTDRTGVNRETLSQTNPVDHECEANVQALINISRKRLCKQASKETQDAWKLVVDKVKEENPVIGSVLVPECVYRGFCPERKCCGFYKTQEFYRQLEDYRNLEA